jgi:hypothetical protein
MIELELVSTKGSVIKNIPENWNELTRVQLVDYCRYIFPYRKLVFSVDDDNNIVINKGYEETANHMYAGMLFSLLDMQPNDFVKLEASFIHDLIFNQKLLNFLVLEYDLESNLIDMVRVNNVCYYGPSSFSQLTWDEFVIADRAYLDFIKTGDTDYLDNFFATIYRKLDKNWNPEDPDTTGDKREKFNMFTIQIRKPFVAQIPLPEKLAALVFYECERDLMIANNSTVFTAGSGDPVPPADTVLSIAGGLANFNIVRESKAIVVISEIKRLIKQNKPSKNEKTVA